MARPLEADGWGESVVRSLHALDDDHGYTLYGLARDAGLTEHQARRGITYARRHLGVLIACEHKGHSTPIYYIGRTRQDAQARIHQRVSEAMTRLHNTAIEKVAASASIGRDRVLDAVESMIVSTELSVTVLLDTLEPDYAEHLEA